MKKTTKMHQHAKRFWDVAVIIRDLRGEDWYLTEEYLSWVRVDRRVYLSSYESFEQAALETLSESERKRAVTDGWGHEVADDYSMALGEVLTKSMGDHVYVGFDEGDVFAGQYEEGSLDELSEMGIYPK